MDSLTEREREIVRLAHKSNTEIGKALGISANTVKVHIAHIYQKLGVTSRPMLMHRISEGGRQ